MKYKRDKEVSSGCVMAYYSPSMSLEIVTLGNARKRISLSDENDSRFVKVLQNIKSLIEKTVFTSQVTYLIR